MSIEAIILNAAKLVGIPGQLLLAMCMHESANFQITYSPMDGHSPSYGICQIKRSTAEILGFEGTNEELMDTEINAKYAALYLRYQQSRYDNDWVKLAAAYNSGSYLPSQKVPGCPKNLSYIVYVRNKLPNNLKHKLYCGRRNKK